MMDNFISSIPYSSMFKRLWSNRSDKTCACYGDCVWIFLLADYIYIMYDWLYFWRRQSTERFLRSPSICWADRKSASYEGRFRLDWPVGQRFLSITNAIYHVREKQWIQEPRWQSNRKWRSERQSAQNGSRTSRTGARMAMFLSRRGIVGLEPARARCKDRWPCEWSVLSKPV